jgi:hypothetical protein
MKGDQGHKKAQMITHAKGNNKGRRHARNPSIIGLMSYLKKVSTRR